jgi:uncharacterized protein YbaR (Trm112 family)
MKAGHAVAGESRLCPHCKATILKTAVACPMCRHVLRFGATLGVIAQASPTTCPLLVEGTINNPRDGDAQEYFILLEIRDATGKLLSRQSVGVGALQPADRRSFALRIEMTPAMA